jgi:hypothetical protein
MSSLFSPSESGGGEAQRYVWLNPTDYGVNILRDSLTGSPLSDNQAGWVVNVTRQLKEQRGINLSITVKNISDQPQPAPYIKLNSGMYHRTWNGAGADSNFRHVLNYMSHDSFGMRSTLVSPATVANEKFGDPNAIYSVNWFAPCLAVDNWAVGRAVYGLQMMSVSTDYPYPFRIYGDYDPSTLKAYFRLEGNVNISGKGVLDTFSPGEERTWTVWLRFEIYNHFTSVGLGGPTYRKIAALRSYEPYFVSYWRNNGEPDHGPRISGRVYGVDLAGSNAPKAYFSPRDNPRRYYLFATETKSSLDGQLPLPGQEYMNPQTVGGWGDLLDAVADVPTLKTYGYQAVLLLHPGGWGNADQGGNPSIFTALPPNLRNTIPEIKEWENTNGLRVFFAADNTLKTVNTGIFSDSSETFDHTNIIQSQSIAANFDNGSLRSAGGLALFDLPNAVVEPWVMDYLSSWRIGFSSVLLSGKNRTANETYAYVVPSYMDRSEYLTADYSKGGRDWFLDLLLFGADPWVYMPIKSWYADYGTSTATETAYDDYAQTVEKEHQGIVVTIGRIARSACRMPRKRNWKEEFKTLDGITAYSTLCTSGDPALGGRKSCTNEDLTTNYTSNIPTSLRYDIVIVYQYDGLYDWSAGHSWFPGLGGFGDDLCNGGDSLKWLWEDDKLELARQSLINNINGTNRPSGPYIEAGFEGHIVLNWEPWHAAGVGLAMYTAFQTTTLHPSTPGSGLSSRTLRDWWIYVLDLKQPGWSTGKTVAQQDVILQQTWADRWAIWQGMIANTFRTQRPNTLYGIYAGSPIYGTWDLVGLDYGVTNPDVPHPEYDLEVQYWKEYVSKLDFLGPSMYLWDYHPDYDAPLLYSDAGRLGSDPIQSILFHILLVRNQFRIANYCGNIPVIPFIWSKHLRDTRLMNTNVYGMMYKGKYLAGCQGVIWWDVLLTPAEAVTTMNGVAQNWYPHLRDIQSRYLRDIATIDPPATVSVSEVVPPNAEGESDLARLGITKLVRLDKKKPSDPIDGFGVTRYNPTPSGGIGDEFPFDYSAYDVIAIANSVDGTLQLSKALGKYNRLEADIVNPVLTNVGMPHWVIEDTFEWVNSGMPSHLSQVHHSNILSGGLAGERIAPGNLDAHAPAYQAKYIIPCNTSWYDVLNSTIDYDLFLDNANTNLSIPYANAVLYVAEKGQVWAAGYGGVLVIDIASKSIDILDIPSDRSLLIKDMKKYQDKVYILDETRLFIYNLTTETITNDIAQGLSGKLHSVASVFGSNIVIGTSDGLYARKAASLTWKKVVSTTKAVNILSSPDALLSVSDDGGSYYSTDGFTWNRVGIVNEKIVNKVQKHRSQILFATNTGLYQDGGSFYTSLLSLQLLDILNDVERSSEVVINDIDSNFNKAVIGLSDGRYVVYTDGFVMQPLSKLSTIHKVLIVEDDIWLFGYNQFRVVSETFVRKIATGVKIP